MPPRFTDPEDDVNSDDRFIVVFDQEEAYSLWPASRPLPTLLRPAGKSGSRQECLQFINAPEAEPIPREPEATPTSAQQTATFTPPYPTPQSRVERRPVPPSPWINIPKPVPDARARLLVVPHAGGHPVAFRAWPTMVPPHLEVLLVHPPGRGSRLRERNLTDPEAMLKGILNAVQPYLDLPLVVMGHSLGARIAFALAHRLCAERLPSPVALIVSGRRGPSVPKREVDMSSMPTQALLTELEHRYGVLDEALRHPELAEMLFPSLRADMHLSECWPSELDKPLNIPLHARGGATDPSVTSADLEAWRQETRGPFTTQMLPGGHFFLLQDPQSFLASIYPVLRQAVKEGT